MTPITPEMKLAIEQAGDSPPEFVDPETKIIYMLVRADVYESMRNWLAPMLEAWDDPAMDIYNGPEYDKAVREG